jgi:siroheme synthase
MSTKQEIPTNKGKVTLVGFGPGDPDLLTIGGERALSQADIIFHDDLIDRAFLDQYKGEKFYVGKRKHKHSYEQDAINELLLKAALEGKVVVRLKGVTQWFLRMVGRKLIF